MFTFYVIWIWILVYIISLSFLVIFRFKEGFLSYLLSFLGMSDCVMNMIIVPGALGEYSIIWAIISGLIMMGLFFTICNDKVEEFLSINTIKIFIKVIFLFVFLGLLIFSLYLYNCDNFWLEILTMFLLFVSILGLFATIASLNGE